MLPSPVVANPLAGHVARLFYDRQLSKVEIAGRLGISRFRVARLIDEALAGGLVRIEFRDDVGQDPVLGRAVEERFGLDLCVVASGMAEPALASAQGASPGRGDAPAAVAPLAVLAASVLDEMIGPGDAVGIAWGSTLAAVARAIVPRPASGITVVQLAGSSHHLDRREEPGEVSRTLADRLSAEHRALFAPAFVESAKLRAALVRQPDLAATFDEFGRLAVAVVGIGAIAAGIGAIAAGIGTGSSSLLESGSLSDAEIEGLRAKGAAGDLVVHAFDASGTFIAPDLALRAVAIDVDQLRRTRVLAVAGGAGKAAAIRGALSTGVVDMLVTDAGAALALLESDVRADPGTAAAASAPGASTPAASTPAASSPPAVNPVRRRRAACGTARHATATGGLQG